MKKRPFLIFRMIVDALFVVFFVMTGLGEFTARIHGWPSLINLGSVVLCLLVAAGFALDFSYTWRVRKFLLWYSPKNKFRKSEIF